MITNGIWVGSIQKYDKRFSVWSGMSWNPSSTKTSFKLCICSSTKPPNISRNQRPSINFHPVMVILQSVSTRPCLKILLRPVDLHGTAFLQSDIVDWTLGAMATWTPGIMVRVDWSIIRRTCAIARSYRVEDVIAFSIRGNQSCRGCIYIYIYIECLWLWFMNNDWLQAKTPLVGLLTSGI